MVRQVRRPPPTSLNRFLLNTSVATPLLDHCLKGLVHDDSPETALPGPQGKIESPGEPTAVLTRVKEKGE